MSAADLSPHPDRQWIEQQPRTIETPRIDAMDVTRAVVLSQFLFSAGHLLTTGGFLYYFANALKPTATMFAVLMIVPELCEVVSLWCRPLIVRIGSRKWTWAIFSLLARLAALAIPAMAFPALRPGDTAAFWIIVGGLAASSMCQSISYVAYLSWISDIVPQDCFGRFFALRRIANVIVLAVLPYLASQMRGDWSHWHSREELRWAYVIVFLTGGGLLLLNMVPLLRVPELPVVWNEANERRTQWSRELLWSIWKHRSLRFVLISSWWLAAFQGLTQAVFYQYQTRVLHLSIETYFLMAGLMYAMQIPLSALGGVISDRLGDRGPLLLFLPLTSIAMLFWLLATPDHPHLLYGAYAIWGLFGLINVCDRNLLLRVSPRSDNSVPLALSRSVSGVLAALCGLAGGFLLDRLLQQGRFSPLIPFQILFILSWIGRLTASLWLIPVTPPSSNSSPSPSPARHASE